MVELPILRSPYLSETNASPIEEIVDVRRGDVSLPVGAEQLPRDGLLPDRPVCAQWDQFLQRRLLETVSCSICGGPDSSSSDGRREFRTSAACQTRIFSAGSPVPVLVSFLLLSSVLCPFDW